MEGVCGEWSGLCGEWSGVCVEWSSVCGEWSGVCGEWSGVSCMIVVGGVFDVCVVMPGLYIVYCVL